MQTSPEIKNIAAALVGFHREVDKIKKDSKNPFFKSSYASLSGILESIDGPLINNGLVVVQFPEGENGLTTRVIHTSGEWMESSYTMQPVKNTPQDRGSSLTYQRRYAIGAILSLQIDDDDDGNAASTPPKQQPAKAPQAPPKPELPEMSEDDLTKLRTEADKCGNLDSLNNLFGTQKTKFKIDKDSPAMVIYNRRKLQLEATTTINNN